MHIPRGTLVKMHSEKEVDSSKIEFSGFKITETKDLAK